MHDFFKKKGEWQQGFTLIELLIVIVIIGILATLLMTNFIGVRQRARDAERKSDIKQMQSALELYRADTGSYPVSTSSNSLNSVTCPTSSSFMSSDNSTTYMQKVPCDPLGSGTGAYNNGNYYYNSNGTTYTLTACLENTSDAQGTTTAPIGNPSGCTTDNGSGFYYTVDNP